MILLSKAAGPRGMRVHPLGDAKKLQRDLAFSQWSSFLRPQAASGLAKPALPKLGKQPKMPAIPVPPALHGVLKSQDGRVGRDTRCAACGDRHAVRVALRKADGVLRMYERPCPECNSEGALPIRKSLSEGDNNVDDGILDFIKSRGRKKKKAKQQDKVHTVMHEFKHGELHSGSKRGPKVTSRKQAIAIALNQARKVGKSLAKGKDTYQCRSCGYGFPSAEKLANHMRQEHPRDAYKCRSCGKGFPLVSMLEGHMRSEHPKESPYRPDLETEHEQEYMSGPTPKRKVGKSLGILDYLRKAKGDPVPGGNEQLRIEPEHYNWMSATELPENPGYDCPMCGGPGVYMGHMGNRVYVRCRNCGLDYSHRAPVEKSYVTEQQLRDRAATRQPTPTNPASQSRPGDSRDCPHCGGPGVIMGYLGNRTHLRCRMCGMDYFWDTGAHDDWRTDERQHGALWEMAQRAEIMERSRSRSILEFLAKAKSMRLGGGGRFQKLKNKLAKRKGVKDAGAIAAAIGRKKYGKKKFQKLAARGKKRR
jgi:transcription elongation factor Elf1